MTEEFNNSIMVTETGSRKFGSSPFIQVFILAYERPVFFKAALKSVLDQDYENFIVIVSDNSKSDSIKNVVFELNSPKILYRQRTPSLPAIEHFNQVLSEAYADYFMMFHDDDVMFKNCLSELMRSFKSGEKLVAIGGNARKILGNRQVNSKFCYFESDQVVSDAKKMLRRYLLGNVWYSPFPAYLYYRPLMSDLRLPRMGKHADVLFVSQLCERAPVKMLKSVVMAYRFHDSQDSVVCVLRDRWLMLKWICPKYYDRRSPEIIFFRLNTIYQKRMVSGRNNRFSKTGFRLLLWRYVFQFRLIPWSFFLQIFRWLQRRLLWMLNFFGLLR